MAQYTRSAADQFRPEEAAIGWLWNIFVFSVVVFSSISILYLSIEFGYKSFLTTNIENTQKSIDEKRNKISVADQESLVDFYSQVYNINQLLIKHPAVSKIFNFFEENAIKSVVFNKLRYSKDAKIITVAIDAETKSMDLVASQLEALRRKPEVKEVILGSAAESEGKTQFTIRVGLDPNFLLNN